MLNSMIFNSMEKYDGEIAKCTDFYSKQCAAMEACRGQVSASTYIATNSRTLILYSKATINKCEVDIPATQYELKDHNQKRKNERKKLNNRLKIAVGDIAVMTTILTMTDCDAKKKTQLHTENFDLMYCEDKCTHKSFITSSNGELKKQLGKLLSVVSHNLLHDQTADLFDGIASLQSLELEQCPQAISNKTQFNGSALRSTYCNHNHHHVNDYNNNYNNTQEWIPNNTTTITTTTTATSTTLQLQLQQQLHHVVEWIPNNDKTTTTAIIIASTTTTTTTTTRTT